MLTSSCEDKKQDNFGAVSINFEYQKEVIPSEDESTIPPSNKTSEILPIKKDIFSQKNTISKESLFGEYQDTFENSIVDSPLTISENENNNDKSSNSQSSGVSAARIGIGSNIPTTIDLNTQTSYSRTDLAIGSTVITVSLLDNISSNITLYQQSKSIEIVKNITTNVIFNDFIPANQSINLSDTFEDEYITGQGNISLAWTNTHPELPVSIQLIQNSGSTVLKTIQSNYIGNSFSWNTSSESPANNIGFKIFSDVTGGSVSSSACCFNLVPPNNAPIANNVEVSANKDETISITLDGSDSDGSSLDYSIINNPSNGSLGTISGNTITYTPNQSFNGTDTFTYKVNDGIEDSNVATVTIAVFWAEITNPITSSIWAADGSAYNITWSGGFPNTGIELWNNDSKILDINTNVGSVNTFAYTPTGLGSGSNYQIRIYDTDESGEKDDLSDYFTITDGSTPLIIFPSESSNFDPFQDVSIIWSNFSFNSRIELWRNNQYYQLIAPANPNGGGWNGSYTWASTRLPSGDQYQIRLLDISNSNTLFSSYFTVNNIGPSVEDQGFQFIQTSSVGATDITLNGDDYNYDNLSYTIVTNPTNGSASINGSTLTYNPNAGFSGSESILFNANDGELNSNVATLSILIYSNNSPTVNDLNPTTPENTAIEINVTGSDEDGDTLTYHVITPPENGSISDFTVNGGVGLVTYTPSTNWNGTDLFTYYAQDDSDAPNNDSDDHGTVTITVTPINNNTPITENINTSTDEDIAKEITLLGSDADNDNLTYTIVSNSSNGSVSLNGGIATYTPNTNWSGTDTFTYKVSDGNTDSNTSTTTITVTAVNDAPTVETYSSSTNEDIPITVSINQGDIDGDTATASIVSQPSNGTLSALISGTNTDFTYNPNTNWNGTDTFTYKATDPSGASSAITTGTITVISVNDLPDPTDIETTTLFNTSTVIVLSATDIEGLGAGFSYELVTTPSHASSWSGENNTTNKTMDFTYTPTTGWSGVDTFTYKVNDGTDDSTHTGEIKITTLSTTQNNPPIANNVTGSTNEDTAYNMTLNGTDSEGNALTYSIVSNPTNGTLGDIYDTTEITYTPNANWNGIDTWVYQVNDGNSNSNTATATVTVVPINDAPIANNFSISTNEDTAIDTTLTFDTHYTDIDAGSSWSFYIVSNASNGTVSQSGDPATGPTITYTPNNNWSGTDTFTWKVDDGTTDSGVPQNSESNTATITVIVESVNDAPTTEDASGTNDEDQLQNIDLVSEANDVEGDNLTYAIVTDVSNGTTSLSGSLVTYEPNANFSGVDSFTWKVNDGDLDSNTSSRAIIITPVNDNPTVENIEFSIDMNTVNFTWTFTGNDVDGDNLTFSALGMGPSNGQMVIDGNEGRYTPNNGWSGLETFKYKANDGNLDSNEAQVSIEVNAPSPLARAIWNFPPENPADEPLTEGQTYGLQWSYSGDVFPHPLFSVERDVNWISGGAGHSNASWEIIYEPISITPEQIAGGLFQYNWLVPNNIGDFEQYYTAGELHGRYRLRLTDESTQVEESDTWNFIFVNGQNNPVTTDFSTSTSINETVYENFNNLSSDQDGDDLTFSIVTAPSNGSVIIEGGNVFAYTPATDFTGNDTFTYQANDGVLDSNISTVTVMVGNSITLNADVYANARDDYIAYIPIDYTSVFDINESAPGGIENHTGTSGTPKGEVNFVKCENGTINFDNNNVPCDNEGKYYIRYKGTQSGYDSFSFYVRDINGAKSNMKTAYTLNAYYDGSGVFLGLVHQGLPQVDSSLKILTFGNEYLLRATNGGVIDGLQIRYYGPQNGNDHAWIGQKLIDENIDGNHPNVSSYNANGMYYNFTLTEDLIDEQGQPSNTNKYSFGSIWTVPVYTNTGQTPSNGTNGSGGGIKFITNHRPVTSDINISSPQNIYIDFDISASDEDGDFLTAFVVDQPSNGTIDMSNLNGVRYTPNNGFHGTETFTFRVGDVPNAGDIYTSRFSESELATITINVLDSSTIYMHTGDSHGVGTLEDPMSIFDKAKDSLTADPNTGYATVILLPGTYTSNYDASAGANAGDETIQLIVNAIGLHLKSYSGDPSDTIIERGNTNWNVGATDGGHNDGSGKLKIEDITFRGNRESHLNISAAGDWIIIDNCIFSDIENTGQGGTTNGPLIGNYSSAGNHILIENSTFEDLTLLNTKNHPSDIYYGTLAYSNGTITINNSTFTNVSNSNNVLFGVPSLTPGNININHSRFIIDGSHEGLAYAATATHSVFINFDAGNYGLVAEGVFTNSVIANAFLGSSNGNGGIIKNSIIINTDLRAVQGTHTWSGGYNASYDLGQSSSDGNYSFTGGITVNSIDDILFTDYNNHDFHLQVRSPAIDIGDPNDDYSNEPEPNGDRINAGIYGNTNTAQTSNTAPTTIDIAITINENRTARMADITLQGSDIDGDNLTYSIVSDASNGSTSISGATLTYTANQDWNGTETITYKANDGEFDSNTSTITVTVTPVNDTPVVTDNNVNTQSLSFSESNTYVTLPEIDANLGTPNSTMTISVWVKDANNEGTFIQSNAGWINADASQSVDFGRMNVWNNKFAFGLRNKPNGIEIEPISTTAVTLSDWNHVVYVFGSSDNKMYINGVETSFDRTSTYNASDTFYAANRVWELGRSRDSSNNNTFNNFTGYLDDVAIWNIELSDSQVSDLYSNGSMLTANNVAPNNLKAYYNFEGSGNTVIDQSGNGKDGTITNTSFDNEVVGNHQVGNSVTTNKDTAVAINLANYVSDVDGDNLTYSVVSDVSNGSTSQSTVGGSVVTYTPSTNYSGLDEFTWKANDGTVNTRTSKVQITVLDSNAAPTTSSFAISGDEDTVIDANLGANSNDANGDNLTYTILTTPSNGSVSLSAGIASYTPNANWSGSETIAYKVNDGTVDSNISIVTITVNPINDAPIANNMNISTNRQIPISITLNATDVENNDLTYSIVSGPSSSVGGSLGDIDGNTVVYTAPNGGTDSFTYKANDGLIDSNIATVNMTITSNNNAPTVQDTTIAIGGPISGFNTSATEILFSLPGDDLDESRSPYTDEALLTYSIVDNPKGWFGLTGHPDHIPNNAKFGHEFSSDYETQSMTYKATDSQGAESNIGTVTINTLSENDQKSIYLPGQGGGDSYIDISAGTSATESTIMMWIKILPFSGSETGNNTMTSTAIVADWSTGAAGGAHYLSYHYSQNQSLHKKLSLYKEFYLGNTSSSNIAYNTDLGEVTMGEWTHIAIATGYDINNFNFQAIYINGTLVATHAAIQAGSNTKGNGVSPVKLGKNKGTHNSMRRTSMMVDDYAIFPTRLSQSDIQSYMSNMTTDANIVENYHNFNAGSLSDIVGGSAVSGQAYFSPDSPHN
jgi:large repetitive protein